MPSFPRPVFKDCLNLASRDFEEKPKGPLQNGPSRPVFCPVSPRMVVVTRRFAAEAPFCHALDDLHEHTNIALFQIDLAGDADFAHGLEIKSYTRDRMFIK